MHRLALAPLLLAVFLVGCGDTMTEQPPAGAAQGPLAEKLAARKAAGMAKMPDEVKQVFARSAQDLAKSDLLAKALKAGARAPAFTLKDALGQDTTLAALLKEGPLVLTFYRGKW